MSDDCRKTNVGSLSFAFSSCCARNSGLVRWAFEVVSLWVGGLTSITVQDPSFVSGGSAKLHGTSGIVQMRCSLFAVCVSSLTAFVMEWKATTSLLPDPPNAYSCLGLDICVGRLPAQTPNMTLTLIEEGVFGPHLDSIIKFWA